MKDLKQAALNYHANPIPGKLDIKPTKAFSSQQDLSLAYSPGVAYPCLEIRDNPEDSYKYTSRGNIVSVISDGTAVLGLGDIGSLAGMPVMEGKCILLKKFADISGIPLVMKNHKSPSEFIENIASLEDSFGAINLEDIKAPECFEVEEQLKKRLSIPVFHDDQHGTAIISLAGLLNSLDLVDKKIEEVKIVVNGAGAAGIACAKIYVSAGAKKENIFMLDSRGLITKGREGLNKYKEEFVQEGKTMDLEQAMKDADVFVGVSVADILTESMVKSMAKNPIIFALANPNPEIKPDLAYKYGAKIVATGRSDYANQVNNVLGFPGIFRGALDTRSSEINEEMKVAAARAIREVALEEIPVEIQKELGEIYPIDAKSGMFSKKSPVHFDYIIPKPFDRRVVPHVASYVADAAMKSGVARIKIKDLDKYEKEVSKRLME